MNYTVLEKPLSVAEMREMSQKDKDGYISGVIEVELTDIIDNDFECFLDLVSEYLTDSNLLMNTQYELVGCDTDQSTVHLLVRGDPSEILEQELGTQY